MRLVFISKKSCFVFFYFFRIFLFILLDICHIKFEPEIIPCLYESACIYHDMLVYVNACVRACMTTHAPELAWCFLSNSGQSVEKNRERMWPVVPLLVLFALCMYRADEIDTNEIDVSAPRKAQHVHNATLGEIFENAVQAYLEEDWDGCVAGFNDALHGYVVIMSLLLLISLRDICYRYFMLY